MKKALYRSWSNNWGLNDHIQDELGGSLRRAWVFLMANYPSGDFQRQPLK